MPAITMAATAIPEPLVGATDSLVGSENTKIGEVTTRARAITQEITRLQWKQIQELRRTAPLVRIHLIL